jgi:hypothetical protein
VRPLTQEQISQSELSPTLPWFSYTPNRNNSIVPEHLEDLSLDDLLNPLQFSPVDEAEQFDISTPRLEMTVEARQANLHLAKAGALAAAHELAELERHENEWQLQQEALAPGRDDVEMAEQMAATLKGTTIDDDSDGDLADDPSLGQSDQGSEPKPKKRKDMKETPGPWPMQPGVSSVSGGPEAAAPEHIPAAQPSSTWCSDSNRPYHKLCAQWGDSCWHCGCRCDRWRCCVRTWLPSVSLTNLTSPLVLFTRPSPFCKTTR